jgi:hypothetical protein
MNNSNTTVKPVQLEKQYAIAALKIADFGENWLETANRALALQATAQQYEYVTITAEQARELGAGAEYYQPVSDRWIKCDLLTKFPVSFSDGEVIKYRAIKQTLPIANQKPHQAALQAEYAKQVKDDTTGFYLWQFQAGYGGWLTCKNAPAFLSGCKYRYTDISCYVSKDSEPAIRMLRMEARELQSKLGDTVEWFNPENDKVSAGIELVFNEQGTYTYHNKASEITLVEQQYEKDWLKLDTDKQQESEYITAKQARELGVGNAEWRSGGYSDWQTCDEDFQYFSLGVEYRAIKQAQAETIIKHFGTIHEENGKLMFTDFSVDGCGSTDDSQTAITKAAIKRIEASLKQAQPEPTQFKRENRYIVLKNKDVAKLPLHQRQNLKDIQDSINSIRSCRNKPELECVVVESDNSTYAQAWKLIKQAQPEPVIAALEEINKCIDKNLEEFHNEWAVSPELECLAEKAIAKLNSEPVETEEESNASWAAIDAPIPHADLRVEYIRQRDAVPCELGFYLWERKDKGMADFAKLGVPPAFYPFHEYRCTDISCMVSKDGEPAIRMLRTEAQELQRKLGDTVEWNLFGTTLQWEGEVFTFNVERTYTYRTKATIKLDHKMVTREQAAAEWEAKKETHEMWFQFGKLSWTDVIGFPTNLIDYFIISNDCEYELRPKELNIVSWGDVPQFVKVQHKTTKQTFAFLGVDTFGYLAVFRRDCDDYSYNPPALELAPANEQPWMYWGGGECPVPDGCTFEVACRSGNVRSQKEVADWTHTEHGGDIVAYRITGIAKGYKMEGAV